MANEWKPVDASDLPIRRFTIATGLAVSQGQLLGLSDPRTVIAQAVYSPTAGVAAEEHKPDVGVTSIGVWYDGVFEAVASGALSISESIIACPNNFVASAAGVSAASNAIIIGTPLEAASDEETINVRLRL